jgi:hypothetical protein
LGNEPEPRGDCTCSPCGNLSIRRSMHAAARFPACTNNPTQNWYGIGCNKKTPPRNREGSRARREAGYGVAVVALVALDVAPGVALLPVWTVIVIDSMTSSAVIFLTTSMP